MTAPDAETAVAGWRPPTGMSPVLAAQVRGWVVAAALGAGLRGTELAGVTAGQVVDLDGGRLL